MDKNPKNENASLVVVGTGIKFMAHITVETRAYIMESDYVLYLVNEPLMEDWIQNNHPQAESLEKLYTKYPLRSDCYQAIRDYILENLYKEKHICVAIYGHPTVFSEVVSDAVKMAREKGYYAKVLPGISAEDCLFADLLVDPGSCGCQSYEATDLLIHRRPLTPQSHLILWQVGIIGILGHQNSINSQEGLQVLVNYLKDYYSLQHKVFLYEAEQYPSYEPYIQKTTIEKLPEAKTSRLTTLYIPPESKLPCDQKMLESLKMNIQELE